MVSERNTILVALGMGLLAGLLAALGIVVFSGATAVAADETTPDLLPGTFSPTGSLAEPRVGHAATLLPDGRVLVVGGKSDSSDIEGLASAVIWDPGTASFESAGSLAEGGVEQRLYRRTVGDWELLGDDGSVPMLIVPQMWDGPSMTVSSDGRLWIAFEGPGVARNHRDFGDKSYAATLDGECAGVISFDGATWSQHLVGACATHVSAAPNGNVWAIVPVLDPEGGNYPVGARRDAWADLERGPAGPYVITPEAVAATE